MFQLQCIQLSKVSILCHAGFCSKCWEKLLFASEVYMCCSDVVICGSSTVCLEFFFKQLPNNEKWKTSISLIIKMLKINIWLLMKVLKSKMSVVKICYVLWLVWHPGSATGLTYLFSVMLPLQSHDFLMSVI
jgi:hypothetical protein